MMHDDTSWSNLCPENSQEFNDDGDFEDDVDNLFLVFV